MKATEKLIGDLKERAKELRCLYEVEKALNELKKPLAEVMGNVVAAIGPGWKYPEICVVSIELDGEEFQSPAFQATPWALHADITVNGEGVGRISVFYREERPAEDESCFLAEEVQLLTSLADRLPPLFLF